LAAAGWRAIPVPCWGGRWRSSARAVPPRGPWHQLRRLKPDGDITGLSGQYRRGDLKLDDLATITYKLVQVNSGYDDLLARKNIRGVIVHEH
jgi:hypothetical protein